MPDQWQEKRVICSGGLHTNEDTLTLSSEFPGAASRLVNYEVSQRGGYRRIDGYRKYASTSDIVPGTGAVLGCWVFGGTIYAARSTTGSEYSVYKYSSASGAWGTAVNVLSTGSTDVRSSVGVSRLRVISHNFEGSEKMTITDGVNFPATLTSGNAWEVLTSASSSGAGADLAAAKVARDFKNHMAYAGMGGLNSNLVVLSAPNDHDNFSAGSGVATINVGFAVKALAVFRNDLYVFGKDQIKKITGNNSTDFQQVDVTKNIGVVSTDSVVEVGGDVLYWSYDGIRLISGTDKIGDVNLQTVSHNIKATLLDKIGTGGDSDNILGVVVRDKTQFRYFIYDTSAADAEAIGIIGGVRYTRNVLSESYRWEFGDLLGIKANCAHSGFIGNNEVVIHGSDTGYIYQSELGDTSFDGSEILSVYTTPYLDVGSTETLKDWDSIHIFFRPEGPLGWSIGLGLGWDDPDYEMPPNFNLSVSTLSAIYDDSSVLYDNTAIIYDGYGRTSRRINITCTAPSMKFSLVRQSAVDKPHSVQGFVLRYSEHQMRTN